MYTRPEYTVRVPHDLTIKRLLNFQINNNATENVINRLKIILNVLQLIMNGASEGIV